MTKEVLVSIFGLQVAINDMEKQDDEPIEIISAGTHFFKDGTHYIFFEEMEEGTVAVTKTQMRIHGKELLEVTKKGVSNMHMIFEKSKNNRCYYKTPYGQLDLGIWTRELVIEETETNIHIKAEYTLGMNGEPLSNCTLQINIKPRQSEEIL